MSTKPLSIDLIRIDGGTQSRVKIDDDHVSDLTEAWKAKAEMPAVVIFHDGADYWLAEGFHRYHSAVRAKRSSLPCDIRNGTKRDAVLFSVGANQGHGLKRTNADKRKAVNTLLADEEWSEWSSAKIAEQAGVSHTFVEELRNQPATVAGSISENTDNSQDSQPVKPPETRIGRDGKRRPAKPKSADPEKARLKAEKKEEKDAAKAAKEAAKSKPAREPGDDPTESQHKPEAETAVLVLPEKDEAGNVIPKNLREIFGKRPVFMKLSRDIAAVRKAAEELSESDAGAFLRFNTVKADIDNAARHLRGSAPYAVCPYCKSGRKGSGDCPACKGLGWVNEGIFKQAPEAKS